MKSFVVDPFAFMSRALELYSNDLFLDAHGAPSFTSTSFPGLPRLSLSLAGVFTTSAPSRAPLAAFFLNIAALADSSVVVLPCISGDVAITFAALNTLGNVCVTQYCKSYLLEA